MRGNRHKLNYRKFNSSIQYILCHEGDPILEGVSWGDCGVSVLRNMQNPVRNSPGQPDPLDSPLTGVIGFEISRDPIQPRVSCDSFTFNKDKSGGTEGQQVNP